MNIPHYLCGSFLWVIVPHSSPSSYLLKGSPPLRSSLGTSFPSLIGSPVSFSLPVRIPNTIFFNSLSFSSSLPFLSSLLSSLLFSYETGNVLCDSSSSNRFIRTTSNPLVPSPLFPSQNVRYGFPNLKCDFRFLSMARRKIFLIVRHPTFHSTFTLLRPPTLYGIFQELHFSS